MSFCDFLENYRPQKENETVIYASISIEWYRKNYQKIQFIFIQIFRLNISSLRVVNKNDDADEWQ